MKTRIKAFDAVDRVLTKVIEWVTIVSLTLLFLIVIGKILMRITSLDSFPALDEIVEGLFAVMVFYGAAGVWMIKGHFSVGDWVSRLAKTERGKTAFVLLVELISLAFVFILFRYSLGLLKQTRELTPVLQIPKKYFYSPVTIGSGIMVVYSLLYVVNTVIILVKPDAKIVLSMQEED